MRASLPDERPRLLAAAKFEKTNQPDVFSIRHPRTGSTHTLRKFEALVARSCNGARTVPELFEIVQRHGSAATAEMITDVLRKLNGLGLLEPSVAEVEADPIEVADADIVLAVQPADPEALMPALPSVPEPGPEPRTDVVRPVSEEQAAAPHSAQLLAIESLSLNKSGEHSPSQGSSRLPWVLLGVAMVVGGGYFLWSKNLLPLVGGPMPEGRKMDAPAFRIEAVRGETRTGQALVASGYLSAPDLIQVGATLAGRIKDVKVAGGDKVSRNQVLIQLDDSQMVAELRLARARLRDAERSRSRMNSLYRAEAATQVDLDRAIGQAEIARAEAMVIEERLQQTQVRSPIDGTIIEVPVHPGEVVLAGDARPLIKMGDLTNLVAEVDINEADVPMLRLKQPVEVQSEAVPGRTFEGTVREISQQVDKTRGTVQVKVHLTHPAGLLRPGLSVKATFRADASAGSRILLPRSALDSGQVWVVGSDGKANKVPVTVQAVGPTLVEVTNGLKEGDRVVIDGHSALQAGQRVE